MDATDRNLALARHYLDIEQPRRALEVLDRREHDVGDAEYWRLRATALIAVDRYREALDAAARGLDLDPGDVGLLLVSALAHRGVGDLAAAERALLAALRITRRSRRFCPSTRSSSPMPANSRRPTASSTRPSASTR